jgi:hypothetical protein
MITTALGDNWPSQFTREIAPFYVLRRREPIFRRDTGRKRKPFPNFRTGIFRAGQLTRSARSIFSASPLCVCQLPRE